MTDDAYVEQARELIRAHLRKHADPGVRLLNEMAEVPADHPGIVLIVEALRARDLATKEVK